MMRARLVPGNCFAAACLALAWLAAPAANAETASQEAADQGVVRGVIRFAGDIPNARPIQMNADPVCAAHHDTPPLAESLVLGPGKTMGNVFVQIVEGLPRREHAQPGKPFVLTQEGCRYAPRVFGVRAGQPIRVLNPDGTVHNVNFQSRVNRPINIGMPATMTETELVLREPEREIRLKCDVHPWMIAFCFVLDHPYFTVTGPDGTFEIAGLPPGAYTLEAWHERLGAQQAVFTLDGDAPAEINFTFERTAR